MGDIAKINNGGRERETYIRKLSHTPRKLIFEDEGY